MGSKAGGGSFEVFAAVRHARSGGSSSRVSGAGLCMAAAGIVRDAREFWVVERASQAVRRLSRVGDA
jgi:hypothetical protein